MPSQSPALDALLRIMIQQKASDLHLSAGSHPVLRVHGGLVFLRDHSPLDENTIEHLIYPILSTDRRQHLEERRNLDLSYTLEGLGRFRVNLLYQRDTLGAVFRLIPNRPFTIQELGLPDIVCDLAMRPRGLVLVTGPTGSGKSTTLAAMIHHLNTHADRHVITIEDPIEYLHTDRKCLIRQREVGSDTPSFDSALKFALREDPDVILVGEMRDLETISMAMTAAETGHLVLATLHTSSASSTVDRVIDVFPASQQDQIRLQMVSNLEGVLCQTLLPRMDGSGRACAMEIMLGIHSVRSLIREAKTHQLLNVIETSSRLGMQSMNQALKSLVLDRVVAEDLALERSSLPDSLLTMLAHARKVKVGNGRPL